MFWYFLTAITCLALGCLIGFLVSIRNTAGTSVAIVRMANIVGLSILVKCIEEFSYANTVKLSALRDRGLTRDDEAYRAEKQIDQKIMLNFKDGAVKHLTLAHSGIFRKVMPYTDWRSAMRFLESNKQLAILFRTGAEND